jgi:hypothetical protein
MIRWERGLRQLHLTPTAEPMKVVMPTLEEGIEEVLLPEPVHSQSVVSQSPKEDEADDDNMDHLKDVVGRTSRFKENMNSGQWDDDLVEFILKEIKDFIKVQLESNRNHCIRLFADLLDSLHDGERMELRLSQLIDDVDLIQSNTNKAMYLRIASSLRLLHDQDYNLQMAKNKNKHKSRSQSREKSKPRSTSPIVVSSLSVKSNNKVVPVKKKKIKIITKDEKEDDDDEEVDEHVLSEAWSPKHKEDEEENDDDRGLMCGIDERVLGKLQYRWMATSFTMQGESARKLWVSRFRPPNFGYDDEWLTLEGMLELIRIVLQFTQSEISDDEIESFFNVLDLDNTGSISFYKLVGLLEADNVPLRQRTSTKYKATKKKRKRKKKKDEMMEPSSSTFCGPPWKPAGRKAAHD